MALIHFDLETFSEVDLKRVGSYAYARHPSTDVLCACWSVDDGPIQTWVPGQSHSLAMAPDDWLVGYNVESFDFEIWRWVLFPRYGWPIPRADRILDVMHLAAYANLPGSLGEVARALGTREKDEEGSRLMLRLCKPAREIRASAEPRRLHTPEALNRLAAYCRDDVDAERDMMRLLPRELPGEESAVARATGELNRRGIQVDLPLVGRMIELASIQADNMREVLASITHGVVTSETQIAGITRFCRSRGLEIPEGRGAMDAEAVDGYLEQDIPDDVRTVLSTRRQLAKSSLAKLSRLQDATCADGRVRGLLQYYGAHQTGRWAGRIVQPQNLPRGIFQGAEEYDTALRTVTESSASDAYQMLSLVYGDSKMMDVLSSLIRPCFIARPGTRLHIADYSAIEGRTLAWLAGEEPILQAYRDGLRLYCVAAAGIFGKPYAEINARRKFDPEYKHMDMVGKVVELACGYQGSVGAFNAMGAGYGLYLPEAQVLSIVKAWRASRPRTVNLWYDTERQAIRAVKNPGTVTFTAGGKVRMRFDGNHLLIRLPSGRCLWYRNAHIVLKYVPGFDSQKEALAFMGEDEHGRWGNADTYGGKLVENITQAAARDLLADAFIRVGGSCPSHQVVCMVHDELVTESPSDDPHDLERLMDVLPSWADGLPMKTEAFTSAYYRK